ncbi:MAG: dihydroorotate dehydrogenase electron transfer subunit [Chloroflexota bacterium]|nr:MAG: dihydroorotate dehydrogenase electron transfer subunit [Chloroflexota bacterium]
MKQSLCSVTSNVEAIPGIHLMWIDAPDIAVTAQPGQFITVRCGGFTLRRPFSVHQSSPLTGGNSGEGEIALLFKVTGKGTLWLSQQQKGDRIDILGPLGKGFSIEQGSKNLLLVAGGIGIAPLVLLAQHALSQYQLTLIHGASTAAQLYPFSSTGKKRSKLTPSLKGVQFVPVTEDGSMGKKGMATDILSDFLDWADQVYACGPLDMYKAMAKMSLRAKRNNLKLTKCQIALEVRMGCGFGACYGCTINTKKGLKQVCRDGPVFELDDIIWQEVTI